MKCISRSAIAASALVLAATMSQSFAAEWNMPVPYSDKTFTLLILRPL